MAEHLQDQPQDTIQLPTSSEPTDEDITDITDCTDVVPARHTAACPSGGWGELAAKYRVDVARSATTLSRIRSPVTYRVQLLAQSTALFFPKKMSPDLVATFGAMTTYAHQSPALAVAMDAACLLQLGQLAHDKRMWMAGMKLYIATLRLMSNEVALPPARRSDGGIIGAITCLQTCEFYGSVGTHGSGWRSHACGLTSLLRGRNPGEYTCKALIETNFFLFHIWHGLINRQPIDFPDCYDVSDIVDLAQRIPGMLHDCDHILRDGYSTLPTLTVKVALGLKDMERELLAWTARCNRDPNDSPYRVVSSETLQYLESAQGSFHYVYDFRDLISAQEHTVYTACLLAVRRAILDLDSMLMSSNSDEAGNRRLQSDRKALIQATNGCADSLCMTLPYLQQAKNGKYGLLASVGPLYMAESWYKIVESDMATKKLAWCADISARINKKGVRPLS
ncbi:Signal recognition particle subunit SRP72 [Teratosphaeria destructans]|uniref:Signal recognition particle subunit SRP72 n=1 Tax=Teratosphaeria destructans TaxID=418781 RepID=A0A9W7SRF0_9PEZI|nr:Signal recognition particle subunit SRP72 [Teratosphaeria destructans]